MGNRKVSAGYSNPIKCCRRSSAWHLALACLLVVGAGCQDYRWQWDFQSAEDLAEVEQRARDENKCLFIFYKSWMDSDSNRMHGEILADNQVGALFQDTVNVLLDESAGHMAKEFVARYGVTSAPAFVIVPPDPDGKYQMRTGFMPKEEFINWVRNAKSAADNS